MSNERFSIQQNNEQMLLQRTQRLIESLGEHCQRSSQLSAEKLKHMLGFVVHFPEIYQAMALTKIAEYLVDNMGLHYLDIMTIFQQKAEQEGIGREEREATFQDSMSELFPSMMRLNRDLSVHSLDDLVRLSNITFGLYGLSQIETAEEAEQWIYTLPKVYLSQLEQDHLITQPKGQMTISFQAEIKLPETQQTQFRVIGHATLTQNLLGSVDAKPTIQPTVDSATIGDATARVA